MRFTALLPTVVSTPIVRKAALGAVGLIAAGGAIAGPATAATAAPVERPAAVVAQASGSGKVLPVDYQAQPNFYYCGPAAVRNALSTMDKDVGQDELAKLMGTTEAGTDSAHDITEGLNKALGEDVYRTVEIPDAEADKGQTEKLAADVKAAVDDGRAVVANIAGTATDTDGGVHSFEGGHYIAVVGYDDDGKTVTIADSADPGVASYEMDTEDLADWIASRGYSH